ncbi:MAG TPA: exodeoxyribonuclease VII large subunit [Candidatus Saccharimonadales bacterium]|nr:exodeoxyribonuclease VII large subunit [Candidatus Saccharimonadales bacterium]
MELPTFKVSELIAIINQTLEYAYPSVMVEGEVASFKVSKGKYVFFDLKDDEGVVSCFMMVYQLRHALEDGMHVRLIAQPRLTPWGKFSLTVREVLPVGEGSIKRAFELLKARLDKEGLFDDTRKRALPRVPTHIGLIASVESAGYVDFLKILDGRWGGIEVTVADVQVQGINAAEQIIRAIDHFNQLAYVPEVLVIVRGGGSAEDLAVFNDEGLVRAIAASRVPTLVGVGHEVDTSLADLAADVRAATPSNAAQLLVPDKVAIISELTQREHRLFERIERRVEAMQHLIADAPQLMLARLDASVVEHRRRLNHAIRELNHLDPKVVLQRGYALIRADNTLVRGRASDVKSGDLLTITLARAILKAEVMHVDRKS